MFERKQEAGYDSAITIFSPDGRLFQVEYAIEAVKHGSPIVGIKTEEGVVIASKKKEIPQLIELKSTQKIFKIDEHIGSAISGLHADARIIIDYARVQAQIERLTYDEPIMVDTLVKKISDMKQVYTQQAGIRPFGVSLLIAGVDTKGPQLYSTDPSGTYYGWKATVIGRDGKIREKLEEGYNEKMSLDDAIIHALRTLSTDKKADSNPVLFEIGKIEVKNKQFRMLTVDEIRGYIERI